MSTITLTVPTDLADHENDTVRFIAAKLYESGKLSLGQAADMSNLTKPAFADILADYGVSFINYSIEDILKDVARIS